MSAIPMDPSGLAPFVVPGFSIPVCGAIKTRPGSTATSGAQRTIANMIAWQILRCTVCFQPTRPASAERPPTPNCQL